MQPRLLLGSTLSESQGLKLDFAWQRSRWSHRGAACPSQPGPALQLASWGGHSPARSGPTQTEAGAAGAKPSQEEAEIAFRGWEGVAPAEGPTPTPGWALFLPPLGPRGFHRPGLLSPGVRAQRGPHPTSAVAPCHCSLLNSEEGTAMSCWPPPPGEGGTEPRVPSFAPRVA